MAGQRAGRLCRLSSDLCQSTLRIELTVTGAFWSSQLESGRSRQRLVCELQPPLARNQRVGLHMSRQWVVAQGDREFTQPPLSCPPTTDAGVPQSRRLGRLDTLQVWPFDALFHGLSHLRHFIANWLRLKLRHFDLTTLLQT